MRREEDAPTLAEAANDPETRRWLHDEPVTEDQQRHGVARAEEKWRSGAGAPFVIADATSDAPLGLLNLQFGDDPDVVGLAVSVFPQARGQGIASRALRLGAAWGLRGLGLARVFAEAAFENAASIRAIEKAGFHREGLLRAHCETHGRRHDCVMFSLVQGELDEPG